MHSLRREHKFEGSNILQDGLKQLPFKVSLSLMPLIRYWEDALAKGNEIDGLLALRVIEQVALAPELKKTIDDLSILKSHHDLLELLMTALLPPAMRDERIGAAISPVNFEIIYATQPFEMLMKHHQGSMRMYAPQDSNSIINNKHLWPCSFILDKCYGINIMDEISIIFHLSESKGGLNRYFKPSINTRFSEIVNCGDRAKLSEHQLSELFNNLDNEELWTAYFRPEEFEFSGFVWLDLIEITEAEILSRLKYDLLERDAFLSFPNRRKIAHKLRSLFRIPELHVGLMPFHPEDHPLERYGRHLWHSLLNHPEKYINHIRDSIYAKAIDQQQIVIVDDLGTQENRTSVENALIQKGIRNFVIAPLISPNGLVGFLELGTPTPDQLTALATIKLKDILPIFAVAMERSLNERLHQVQAIIKEQCTAIHPSVGWKFHEVGLRLLEAKDRKKQIAEMETITFKQVYPLFGLVDVRNSSIVRSSSIQADIIQQLSLAQLVLQQADRSQGITNGLDKKIDSYKNRIENGLNTGHEADILSFIKDEIDPVFHTLSEKGVEYKKFVQLYRSALDDELGIVYKRRKAYEESIRIINETLSHHLLQAQIEAQQIFPHYFTKSQTDGVEYNLYIGASIAPKHNFSVDILPKLRFWQLRLTCEMARLAAQIKPRLPIPLDVAQLILLYHTPLSIKFKQDEKRFDVDGAYNLRYEILKKRIDKAMVLGRNERLTQPGTLVVVYSNEKEIEEHLYFLAFLENKGYFNGKMERLEVESMLGVKGLKALRIPLNLHTHINDSDNEFEEMLKLFGKKISTK